MTFEEAMNRLQELSDKIKVQDIPLDDAIKCYEEGVKYYNFCNLVLKDAKQKIEEFELSQQDSE